MSAVNEERVTREEIEAKLRGLQGDAQAAAEGAKSTGIAAGVIGAIVVLTLVYLFGRRRGRAKSAFVEIRRL